MMPTLMGCVADDFTGATDLAGLLARSGVRVSLRIGVPDEPPDSDTAPFEIIALKSRTAPVGKAVDESRAALSWLRQAGAQRFFWKYCSTFDSTPQGNIGPVAEALMEDLDTDQTIYCPAFPENGRSIYMGHLFVGEEPLDESPMRDHPLTPMCDSSLPRLLATQVARPVGLANRICIEQGAAALRDRLAALEADGIAHVIVDAVTDGDLAVIAKACHDMALLTGASAVAMTLPGLWLADGLLSPDAEPIRMPALSEEAIVLSGSCSEMTNRQVVAWLEGERGGGAYRLDPLDLADNGPCQVLAWLAAQPIDAIPLIYATADPVSVRAVQERIGVARAGEIVEQALAACAVAARERGTRRFVVAGGETSGAVTKALGIDRLEVGAEIAPGVPWCFAKSSGQDIAITLKSGNFGAVNFFNDAFAKLSA